MTARIPAGRFAGKFGHALTARSPPPLHGHRGPKYLLPSDRGEWNTLMTKMPARAGLFMIWMIVPDILPVRMVVRIVCRNFFRLRRLRGIASFCRPRGNDSRNDCAILVANDVEREACVDCHWYKSRHFHLGHRIKHRICYSAACTERDETEKKERTGLAPTLS